jgi:serine/threonine-protein kinase RsbW
MLTGAAEHLGLARERLDDLRTAVSEACNNVVLHAYEGAPGPLWIDLELEPGEIRVKVLDRGSGIRSIISPQNRMRVGLALISALADRAEVLSPADGGTEVRMVFAGGEGAAASGPEPPSRDPRPDLGMLRGDVVAFISPVSLLGDVLGRICSTIAIQAHFSVDRHADLDLVADELTGLAREAAHSAGIGFSVAAHERRLELRVGPFSAGSCQRFQTPYVPPAEAVPLQLLADELAVETANGTDTLQVRLADHRPQRGGRVKL